MTAITVHGGGDVRTEEVADPEVVGATLPLAEGPRGDPLVDGKEDHAIGAMFEP
jgi:hypothetical protein